MQMESKLQEAVMEEISRMMATKKIVKVDEIKEDVYIHPTVITVKKDRSVRIAIDTRKMNDSMIKWLMNKLRAVILNWA